MKTIQKGERARGAGVRETYEGSAVAGDRGDQADLRRLLIEALRAMLDRVESERIPPAEPGDAGVVLILEHDQVRCVLVVKDDQCRHGLSPRELEVARLVADGFTNRTIGNTLGISSWTVSTHTRRIFVKLGVSCRAEMVARLFGVSASSAVAASSAPGRPPDWPG